MGSKGFDVARLRDGVLDVEHSNRIPPDGDIVIVKGDDHAHVIYGSAADLEAAGYTGKSTKGLEELADSQMPDARLAEEERMRAASKGQAPAEPEPAPKPARKTTSRRKTAAKK